jgi:thiol-disulfide isomerase/thioredoxin
LLTLVALVAALGFAGVVPAMAQTVDAPETVEDVIPADSNWYSVDEDNVVHVDVYFFWTPTCPYCAKAKPWLEELDAASEWLDLHSLPLTDETRENVDIAVALRDELGVQWTGAVPAFMGCETFDIGFDEPETTGAQLGEKWRRCQEGLQAQVDAVLAGEEPAPTTTLPPETEDTTTDLPFIGEIDTSTWSLPALTVVLAGFDAFNPCAFFVLLFLLSLLVHARSRVRMATIGGIFVLVSGLAYFAFMAAWLNLFEWLGPLRWVTFAAGAVAVTIGVLNMKDFFLFNRGPSLSIPEGAKPGMFKRMRSLTMASSFPAMAVGAFTLAIAVNSYELLCTAGLPLVYTRTLTLNDLPTASYYGYLALYNLVYILPLLTIVGLFVWKLGSRKLAEREGRTLKLLSGTMMTGLGLVLLFAPEWLDNALTAILVVIAAAGVTGIIVLIDRLVRGDPSDAVASR